MAKTAFYEEDSEAQELGGAQRRRLASLCVWVLIEDILMEGYSAGAGEAEPGSVLTATTRLSLRGLGSSSSLMP